VDTIDIKTVWLDILKKLAETFSSDAIEMWIKPATPLLIENNIIKLEVSNQIAFETLHSRYESKILEILKDLYKKDFKIEYSISINLNIPAAKVKNPPPAQIKHDTHSEYSKMLNQSFTFETFVVGPSNRWAYATAESVAKNPGFLNNPFFLYSPSGLGKTHLLHAIGNQILQTNRAAKVLYIAGEGFVNEYVRTPQNNISLESFRGKYRMVDCLLLDDIQFLIGKARSSEEFFYTFNSLFESKKQIVISSDRTPSELSLDQRYISRFRSGMVADIKIPDIETRIAILRKKRDIYKFTIPDDVLTYIAESVKSNIREGKTHQIDNIIQTSQELGMILLETSLANLVNKGVVDKDVAYKYANHPTVLARLIGELK